MNTSIEKRILLGLVLLIVGIVLMMRYFDILPFVLPGYIFSWKSLLVLLGLVFIITEKNKTGGIIMFCVGSAFLLADIMNKPFWDVFQFVIPLVLIIAGLAILMRRQSFSTRDINQVEGAEINDQLSDVNIFGGGEKKITSQNFKGGKLTAIFGGSELDFRQSQMADGVNAIDLVCIFGGVSMKIPEDWHVKNEVTALFGGFSDERSSRGKEATPDSGKVLYLKGLVMFGGGEIKN